MLLDFLFLFYLNLLNKIIYGQLKNYQYFIKMGYNLPIKIKYFN